MMYGKNYFNKMHDKTKDIELVVFVERNNFIVLQTTDEFEAKNKDEKLKFLDGIQKSLVALEAKVMVE